MSQFRSPLAVFALRNEEQLADFESMTQHPFTLGGPSAPVQFLCRLPSNAQQGDYLHASLTFPEQRQSMLAAQYSLTQRDVDSNVVALTMLSTVPVNLAKLSEFALLQLNLHGRHNIIKESAQFTVKVHPETELAHHPVLTPSTSVGKRLMGYCQRLLS
ncbi:hypothetical protein [Pseudoalteromonas sp. GB56]